MPGVRVRSRSAVEGEFEQPVLRVPFFPGPLLEGQEGDAGGVSLQVGEVLLPDLGGSDRLRVEVELPGLAIAAPSARAWANRLMSCPVLRESDHEKFSTTRSGRPNLVIPSVIARMNSSFL